MSRQGNRGSGVTPVVVLSPGCVGDLVLVRLLAASGRVRCSRALAEPGPDPADRVLERLRRSPGGEPVHLGIVYADDLWLVDRPDHDQDAVVARWLAEGIRVIVLRREQPLDRGLSHAVCGPVEVLPPVPVGVDAYWIDIGGWSARLVWDWCTKVAPEAQVVTFEHDLVEAADRQATVDRLAAWLDVPGWRAPPERDLPTADALWARVIDAPRVREELAMLPPEIEA